MTAPSWWRRWCEQRRADLDAYRRETVRHRPAVAKAAGWVR